MENKFSMVLPVEINENNIGDELTLTWADGTNLIFPNAVVYSIWERFMELSNFERTKEELLEMTKLMTDRMESNSVDGNLNPEFSFKENLLEIHNLYNKKSE